MSPTNGDGHFNVIQKTQILAMLSLYEDPEQASEHLDGQGIQISPQNLAGLRRDNAPHIQYIKDSGIAGQLVGPGARHRDRVQQMDEVGEWFKQLITTVTDPETLDTGKAAMLHRYRELMALLIDADSPEGGTNQDEELEPQHQQEVHRGLSLLELITNGREPDETFEQLLLDATRRVAAASGQTFPSSGPDEFPME